MTSDEPPSPAAQIPRSLVAHDDAVISVAFGPDGKTLASGSGDKTIRLWDVATGNEQVNLKVHTVGVTHVAYSPDGKTLASVCPPSALMPCLTANAPARANGKLISIRTTTVPPARLVTVRPNNGEPKSKATPATTNVTPAHRGVGRV
jgi:WD40 repeat protein